MNESLKLYLVRNNDGKYFRSKGYGGYGSSWVDSIEDAKFYTKESTAKGRVTWWAKNYPAYGVPEIVVLEAVIADVKKQEERVKKAKDKEQYLKDTKHIREEKRKIRDAKKELEKAEERLRQLEINKIGN